MVIPDTDISTSSCAFVTFVHFVFKISAAFDLHSVRRERVRVETDRTDPVKR